MQVAARTHLRPRRQRGLQLRRRQAAGTRERRRGIGLKSRPQRGAMVCEQRRGTPGADPGQCRQQLEGRARRMHSPNFYRAGVSHSAHDDRERHLSLRLRADGGLIYLAATYDDALRAIIKTLPRRRWDRALQEWVVPARADDRRELLRVIALAEELDVIVEIDKTARPRLDKLGITRVRRVRVPPRADDPADLSVCLSASSFILGA